MALDVRLGWFDWSELWVASPWCSRVSLLYLSSFAFLAHTTGEMHDGESDSFGFFFREELEPEHQSVLEHSTR